MISSDGLAKFKALYKKKYNIELSDTEAYRMFSQLVAMVKLVNTKNDQPKVSHSTL